MKSKKLALAALAALSVPAFAGTMGPVQPKGFMPFVAADATYSGNALKPYTINGVNSRQTNNGWGARVAAGAVRPLSIYDNTFITFEGGLGYYGSSEQVIDATSSGSGKIDGFDLLAGFMYRYNQLDVYLKGGAMVQTLNVTTRTAESSPLSAVSGSASVKDQSTAMLPEAKVGLVYNYTEAWGFGVSYMHVFGVNNRAVANTSFGTPVTVVSATNVGNPSLNTLLFGLQYNFA